MTKEEEVRRLKRADERIEAFESSSLKSEEERGTGSREDRMNAMVTSDKRTLTNRIDLELRGGNGGKRRAMRVAIPVKNKS